MRTVVISTSRSDRASLEPVLAEMDIRGMKYDYIRCISAMRSAYDHVAGYMSSNKPDLAVVLGDRAELFMATLPLVVCGVPIAHIHGGELTYGAFDDQFRHALTKLSCLHFVAHDEYARRVAQMGEHTSHIYVTGAPCLDDLCDLPDPPIEIHDPPILVVWHPTTLDGDIRYQTDELISALSKMVYPIVVVPPNWDPGRYEIISRFDAFAEDHSNVTILDSLPHRGFASLLKASLVLVGNSSAGIIEAPTLRTPVVNIGTRQSGRIKGSNCIPSLWSATSILSAIQSAISYQDPWEANPYGDGRASHRIMDVLMSIPMHGLLPKRFQDWSTV